MSAYNGLGYLYMNNMAEGDALRALHRIRSGEGRLHFRADPAGGAESGTVSGASGAAGSAIERVIGRVRSILSDIWHPFVAGGGAGAGASSSVTTAPGERDPLGGADGASSSRSFSASGSSSSAGGGSGASSSGGSSRVTHDAPLHSNRGSGREGEAEEEEVDLKSEGLTRKAAGEQVRTRRKEERHVGREAEVPRWPCIANVSRNETAFGSPKIVHTDNLDFCVL